MVTAVISFFLLFFWRLEGNHLKNRCLLPIVHLKQINHNLNQLAREGGGMQSLSEISNFWIHSHNRAIIWSFSSANGMHSLWGPRRDTAGARGAPSKGKQGPQCTSAHAGALLKLTLEDKVYLDEKQSWLNLIEFLNCVFEGFTSVRGVWTNQNNRVAF